MFGREQRKLVPCGWSVEARASETDEWWDLGVFEERDEADEAAYQALKLARERGFMGAEVKIAAVRRDDMSHEWENEAYHLRVSFRHGGGDLYLEARQVERPVFHKHYEWYARAQAEADAAMLCEALDLGEPVRKVA